MKICAVIPARYDSVRLPAKPLAKIGSSFMIKYVYLACKNSKYKPKVIIATDDKRIADECLKFIESKNEVVITPKNINSGTDRVAFVAKDLQYDYFLNIQGDEPLLKGHIVDSLIEQFSDDVNMVTLATRSNNLDDFKNINAVKVVLDQKGNALYFSRSGIPGSRGENSEFLKHLGLYGFKKDFLLKFKDLKKSKLEEIESLEQLRVLDNGYKIKVGIVDADLIGVDTAEDLLKVENILRKRGDLL